MARFFFTPGFRVKIKKQIPIKHENRTHMMNYQKFHKIKGECIANSIYYLDLLNSVEHGRYKPICGILVVEPKVIAHVWLEDARTNQTIECSYEYFTLPSQEKTYFKSFSDYTKHFSLTDDLTRQLVTRLCALSGCVAQMTSDRKLSTAYLKDLKADLLKNYAAVCSLPIGQGTSQFLLRGMSNIKHV